MQVTLAYYQTSQRTNSALGRFSCTCYIYISCHTVTFHVGVTSQTSTVRPSEPKALVSEAATKWRWQPGMQVQDAKVPSLMWTESNCIHCTTTSQDCGAHFLDT